MWFRFWRNERGNAACGVRRSRVKGGYYKRGNWEQRTVIGNRETGTQTGGSSMLSRYGGSQIFVFGSNASSRVNVNKGRSAATVQRCLYHAVTGYGMEG